MPDGIVSSGWPAVRAKCLDLGVRFDDWQDGLGRAVLAKRADGKYAAGVGGVVISIPRQVGKTYTIGAIVFALCILFPGLTVVWTAHRVRTAGETFRSMQAMARRRKVAPFVEQVFTGSGDEEIRFRNGSRVLFGARERGFGRGFAEVDIEVFDEAQILTEKALDDMVPATNQSKQPAGALLFFMGTPPKDTDPGEAFTAKRKKALAGASRDTLYVELSADPDAHPDDRRQWAKGNPSYPRRTPAEAMLRMRENLSDESFLREGLGIWVDTTSGLALPGWAGCLSPRSGPVEPFSFGVDVSEDRDWSAIAVAAPSGLGGTHVEVTWDEEYDYRPGTGWVVARAAELCRKWGGRVAVAAGSPAVTLKDDLIGAGVDVVEVSTADQAVACGRLFDAVGEGRVRHLGQRPLDVAVAGVARTTRGDTFRWARSKSTVDISPLWAVTLAYWLHLSAPPTVSGIIDLNDFWDGEE